MYIPYAVYVWLCARNWKHSLQMASRNSWAEETNAWGRQRITENLQCICFCVPFIEKRKTINFPYLPNSPRIICWEVLRCEKVWIRNRFAFRLSSWAQSLYQLLQCKILKMFTHIHIFTTFTQAKRMTFIVKSFNIHNKTEGHTQIHCRTKPSTQHLKQNHDWKTSSNSQYSLMTLFGV